jgi:hypothetical protein
MASKTDLLSPREFRRLIELNRRLDAKLSNLVQLDAAPMRDKRTGTFTARGTADAKTLRKVWASAKPPTSPTPDGKASFKSALLAAIRAPRA